MENKRKIRYLTGFTLAETIISIALLVMLVFFMVIIVPPLIMKFRASAFKEQTLFLAKNKLEEYLYAAQPETIAAQQGAFGQPYEKFYYDVQLSDYGAAGNLKQVIITTWGPTNNVNIRPNRVTLTGLAKIASSPSASVPTFTAFYQSADYILSVAEDSQGNSYAVSRNKIFKLNPNMTLKDTYPLPPNRYLQRILNICIDSNDNIYLIMAAHPPRNQSAEYHYKIGIAKLNNSLNGYAAETILNTAKHPGGVIFNTNTYGAHPVYINNNKLFMLYSPNSIIVIDIAQGILTNLIGTPRGDYRSAGPYTGSMGFDPVNGYTIVGDAERFDNIKIMQKNLANPESYSYLYNYGSLQYKYNVSAGYSSFYNTHYGDYYHTNPTYSTMTSPLNDIMVPGRPQATAIGPDGRIYVAYNYPKNREETTDINKKGDRVYALTKERVYSGHDPNNKVTIEGRLGEITSDNNQNKGNLVKLSYALPFKGQGANLASDRTAQEFAYIRMLVSTGKSLYVIDGNSNIYISGTAPTNATKILKYTFNQ